MKSAPCRFRVHYQTDVLLFCSFDKLNRILTICGWITKEAFLQRAAYYPAGTERTRGDGTVFVARADLYEIRNSELHRPKGPADLKNALLGLARSRVVSAVGRAA